LLVLPTRGIAFKKNPAEAGARSTRINRCGIRPPFWCLHPLLDFASACSVTSLTSGVNSTCGSQPVPAAIRAILAHFEKHGALEQAHYRPAARAPPPAA